MKLVSRMRDLVIALSLVVPSMAAIAAPNPASQNWVTNYTNLTPSDWEAACSSGTTGSSTGCIGDYPTKAILKIFRLADNAGFGLPQGVNPSSIFIQKFNGNSNIQTTDKSPLVTNKSGSDVQCFWLSTEGKNLAFFKFQQGASDMYLAVDGFTINKGAVSEPLYSCVDQFFGRCTDTRRSDTPFYVLCIANGTNSLSGLRAR